MINKYRTYCITEQVWVISYGTAYPTSCVNNTNHEINPNSPHILETIEQNVVFVETERIPTGGNYRVTGFMKEIPAGTTGDISTFDESFPHPINLTLVSFKSDTNSGGDLIYADIAPHTIVGINTSAIIGTTSTFSVNSTVIENMQIGYYVDVFTGTTSHNLGMCIEKNIVNSSITTQLTAPDTVEPGNYIRLSIRNIDKYYLSNDLQKTLGGGKIAASYIPKDTIMRVIYKNNNGQAKRVWFDLEYTY